MAWVSPTVEDLKARFPRFLSVDDAVVSQALAESESRADESWASEGDFRLGRMLYAAHTMTLDGFGSTAEAEAAAAGTTGLKRFKSGTFEVERFERSSGVGDVLESTSFGRRYLELLRINRPAVLVV